MPNLRNILILFGILILACTGYTQNPLIEVKDLSSPAGEWGDQTIEFKAFNHDDYIRFIVVKSVLTFQGRDSDYKSENRFSAFLEPGYWFRMESVVTIPGSYGTVTISMEFFDVVDTLDTVLPQQKFMDTSFTIDVEMPESARPWLEKAVVFPPRVNDHPYFDNQFVRIMYAMLSEGKSRQEIARVTGADTDFVDANFKRMLGHRYVEKKGPTLEPTFPLVSTEEAEQVLQLVDRTAEKLSAVVAENCGRYERDLDSLIEAGVLTGDSDNVLGAERVLYRKYVIVSALVLWHELGSQFITNSNPLAIYLRTDICNAHIGKFMYAVPPDGRYHGHHLYALLREGGSARVIFSGRIPELHCEGNFPAKPGIPARATWRHEPEDKPEYFMYSAKTIKPMVDLLLMGTGEVVQAALADLEQISAANGRETLTEGYRYWAWNLIASATLDALIEGKVVEPFKNDNYILGVRGGL